ncbi:hypothetical protein [Cognatiyoonia sp. IB215182]|uniref:hypothetical protein n=1 Tax=Cognatiyoonia sp. IB215182 TaxID=3097353 RepID=UPI002A0AFF75|nr:hypothetical protein [Cognatiyoonia sp. IB215182]MDX8355401.1 hypothetical protein [Cognatiyoonia sp. IB215182]
MTLIRNLSHAEPHRRRRRGVSLFAVTLGLLVGVVMINYVIEDLGRAQKREAGRHLAEVASVMAQRWEGLVRNCAIDLMFCGLSEAGAYTIAGYNTLPVVSGQEMDPIPAALRVHGMQPAHWVGDAPVPLVNGITVRAYVVSVTQAPIATGMLVFEVASSVDVLTRESFRAALVDWAISAGEGEEIVGTEQVFLAVMGRDPLVTEVPVLTYPFVTVESDWVLREPWVGQSGQSMRAELRMGAGTATTGDIINVGSLEALASFKVAVQTADVQSMVSKGDLATQSLTGVDLVAAEVNAGSLVISDALIADAMVVVNQVNAQNVTIADSDEGIGLSEGETVNAGTLKGVALTLPGQLRAGTVSVGDRLQADRITIDSDMFISGDVLGSGLTTNTLTAINGCVGC